MQKKKRRDLRLLFNTNAPHSNSGYAVEMRDVLYRLVADGWPVAVSAFYGVQGAPIYIEYPETLNPKLKGIKLWHYPQMGDQYGADGMIHHAIDFKANAVFSMQDIWTLDPQFLSKLKVWIPWLPIDKSPAPQGVTEKLKYAYKILVFSKFGQQELEKADYISTLIYEGTDLEIFKPMDDQKEARKQLGLPLDIFLFGMIGANKENPPRKGYQEAIDAFNIFLQKHPESALLFHIQQRDPRGFPVKEYANYLGIGDRVFFIADYLAMFNSSSDKIMKEYNAMDVLLHPSQTEGFGLCIIEAQACGKPVIIQKGQSMPELIIEGKTGFGAETLHKRVAPDVSYVYVANPQSVYECMEKVYQLIKTNKEQVAKDCREWVMQNYNIDTLVETAWIPLLESLQLELLPLTNTKEDSTIQVARK